MYIDIHVSSYNNNNNIYNIKFFFLLLLYEEKEEYMTSYNKLILKSGKWNLSPKKKVRELKKQIYQKLNKH